MLKLIVFRVCQFLADILPEKVSRILIKFIFNVRYFFSWKDKKAVQENLQLIMPEGSDVSKAAKEVFHNFGKYLYEFFYMDKLRNENFLKKNVTVQNLDIIDKVLERGKGGIILTAHLGNWELGTTVMNLLGYSMSVVALPHNEESVNKIFNDKREKSGVNVISSQGAVRKCMDTLKKNQLLALVGDRDFSFQGEEIEFLGKKTIIPRGAAIFAQKTGAAIIPVFFTREGEDRFVLSIHEPIFAKINEEIKDRRQEIIELMRKYLLVVERKIREYPTQWLIFREFWA